MVEIESAVDLSYQIQVSWKVKKKAHLPPLLQVIRKSLKRKKNFNLASFQGPDSPQTSFSIPIPHSNPNPNVSNGNLNLPIVTGRAAPATSLIDQTKALAEAQGQEENDNDNWDDDFEDGIDTLKIAQLEKGSEEKETDGKKKKREDEGKRGRKIRI